jgi:hypothetical protein
MKKIYGSALVRLVLLLSQAFCFSQTDPIESNTIELSNSFTAQNSLPIALSLCVDKMS